MSLPNFFTQEVTPTVRLAQVVGITTAGILSGISLGTSGISMPSLLQAPAPLLAQQWRTTYTRGAASVPLLTAIPTLVFSFLAFRERNIHGPAFPLYITAAVLGPATLAFTVAVMKPVNGELTLRSEKADHFGGAKSGAISGENEIQGTHELVQRWSTLNAVRGSMWALATSLALWAAIRPVELVSMTIEGFEFVSGADRLG
jgi:hypothetical protein